MRNDETKLRKRWHTLVCVLSLAAVFAAGCSGTGEADRANGSGASKRPSPEELKGAGTAPAGKADGVRQRALTCKKRRSWTKVILRRKVGRAFYNLATSHDSVDRSSRYGWKYARTDRVLCGTPSDDWSRRVTCLFYASDGEVYDRDVEDPFLGEFQGKVAQKLHGWLGSDNTKHSRPFECSSGGNSDSVTCKVRDQACGLWERTPRARRVLKFVNGTIDGDLTQIVSGNVAGAITNYGERIDTLQELAAIDGVSDKACRAFGGFSWDQCPQNRGPLAESCNGVDDDCNGSVDESLTQSCSNQKGVCQGSTASCSNGSWNSCGASNYGDDYEPTEQSLNDGIDNDCDGETDESSGTGSSQTGSRVSTGRLFSCGIHSSGQVYCWGNGSGGQLGNGQRGRNYETSDPQKVKGLTNAVDLSSGSWHTCAVTEKGTVYCWGNGDSGRLGDGWGNHRAKPTKVKNISTAVRVAAGDKHTCALLSNSSVRCWGSDRYGELGNGSQQASQSSTPTDVKKISTAVDIASGGRFSCALLQGNGSGGSIRCWGENSSGQLGDGSGKNQSLPVQVSGISTAVDVTAGDNHACAVLASGKIQCWGEGHAGELGFTSRGVQKTPATAVNIDSAVQVSAGDKHSCAVLQNGDVWCWGANGDSQVGVSGGRLGGTLPHAPVNTPTEATSVSVDWRHSCAAFQDGSIGCWGHNMQRQLGGDGAGGVESKDPVQVAF